MDIGLLALILGLVEFSKRLGASGRVLTILSMVIGVALSVLYSFTHNPPTTPESVWQTVAFGLLHGLAACGIYDFAATRWPKQDKQTILSPVVDERPIK